MKRFLPVEELARDERFVRTSIVAGLNDPRNGRASERAVSSARLEPGRAAAPDRARSLMHGIFVGEIQALVTE